MRYRAFLSYCRADDRFVNWLHRTLDSYRTPRSIVAREGIHGATPEKLHPIFRDRTDMAGGGELSSNIEAALAESETLLVLCSPHAAQSRWVNAEVEAFLKLGRGARIYPVIAGGLPDSDDVEGDFFPPALRGRGLLAADLRSIKAASGKLIGDGRDTGRLKLIAGLLGVPLDVLLQRERGRQRLLAVGATGAALVFAAVAVLAFWQFTVAARERDAAQLSIARIFIERAWNEFESGRPQLGAKYALAASGISSQVEDEVRAALAAIVQEPGELTPLAGFGNSYQGEVAWASAAGDRVIIAEPGMEQWFLFEIMLSTSARRQLHSPIDFGAGLPPISADGERLLTMYASEEPILISSVDGEEVAQLQGYIAVSRAIPDSRRLLVTNSQTGGAFVWDARRSFVQPLPLEGGLTAGRGGVSEDGNIAAALVSNTLLIEGDSNGRLDAVEAAQRLDAFDFGDVRVWRRGHGDRPAWASTFVSSGWLSGVREMVLSPRGEFVAVAAEGALHILDVAADDGVGSHVEISGTFSSISFSADASKIFAIDSGGAASMFESATGRRLASMVRPSRSAIRFGRFIGSDWILLADQTSLYRWRPAESRLLSRTEFNCACDVAPSAGGVVSLPGDSVLANLFGSVVMMHIDSPPRDINWSEGFFVDSEGPITFSASASGDRLLVSGARVCLYPGAGPFNNGECLDGRASLGVLSADGAFVAASGAERGVTIWNAGDRSLFASVDVAFANALVAFSSDGALLAVASGDGALEIWNWRENRRVATARGVDSGANAVRFMGTATVATAGRGGIIQIWDAETGRERRRLTGHVGEINSIAESSTGRFIASAGSDGEVRVWDAQLGRSLFAMDYGVSVSGVTFSRDERRLVVTDDDGAITVLDISRLLPSFAELRQSICAGLLADVDRFTDAERASDQLIEDAWLTQRADGRLCAGR